MPNPGLGKSLVELGSLIKDGDDVPASQIGAILVSVGNSVIGLEEKVVALEDRLAYLEDGIAVKDRRDRLKYLNRGGL